MPDTEITTLSLRRAGHMYVLMFDNQGCGAAMRKLGVWASDDSLNFNWDDAATLAQKVRTM